MDTYITKGDRITASWLEAEAMASLAGAQPKTSAIARSVSGVVRHIRADRPEDVYPSALFIDPDPGWEGPTVRPPRCTCATEHVLVKPGWIASVG